MVPYRPFIHKILFFGSRAKGTERPDSDYDILILVKKKDRALINNFYDVVMECLLEFGRLISLKIFTVEQWGGLVALKTPFSQQVEKEGIPLG